MAFKIYTKTGDQGETGLFGGKRIPKDDLRIEADGTVDEFNAVVGMLALNAPFGFMSILGLFSLAGIIINNGIVLIDRVDGLRAEGLAPDKAVVEAALARFRPILMTTLTTILGLLPLIVSHDPLFYGLAAVIAFGLLLGTALTLGLVPVLYTLLFRVKVGG